MRSRRRSASPLTKRARRHRTRGSAASPAAPWSPTPRARSRAGTHTPRRRRCARSPRPIQGRPARSGDPCWPSAGHVGRARASPNSGWGRNRVPRTRHAGLVVSRGVTAARPYRFGRADRKTRRLRRRRSGCPSATPIPSARLHRNVSSAVSANTTPSPGVSTCAPIGFPGCSAVAANMSPQA